MESCEEKLGRLEKILKDAVSGHKKEYQPSYGDPTQLNTSRVILDSVGKDLLKEIVASYLDLMGTSGAIYEKNGDYAMGIFSSGWCQFLDSAARRLCPQSDLKEALESGAWACHESCWTAASKKSIAEKAPVDVECCGGIRLYAVPIFCGDKVVGSINFGYGDPPRDARKIEEIAQRYKLDAGELLKKAQAYASRPPYIIEMAKKNLLLAAKFIGAVVELQQKKEEQAAFVRLLTGREKRMAELKKENEKLREKLKEPVRE